MALDPPVYMLAAYHTIGLVPWVAAYQVLLEGAGFSAHDWLKLQMACTLVLWDLASASLGRNGM